MSMFENFIKKSALYRFYTFPEKKLDECVQKFLIDAEDAEKKWIRRKAKLSYILFDLPFSDFFQCRCDKSNYSNIRNIVPYSKGQKPLYKRVNSKHSHDVLCDKWKSFELFGDYYKRDVEKISLEELVDDSWIEKVKIFRTAHTRFIVKPFGMNCGKGIQIIGENNFESFLSAAKLNYRDGFLMEELITQSESLAQLHPNSVNTLRINTVNYNGCVEVKWPCLRMGKGGSVVDNAGSGGIFGAIDVEKGVILSCADEFRHTYTTHPDTNIELAGFQIPQWREACSMVEEMAKLLPDAHFIGWDLALTDNGWVMVEGNYGPLQIYQIATGIGIRKEFVAMVKKLKAVNIL